jgi:tetratricopeptide (TPR) repeat protein
VLGYGCAFKKMLKKQDTIGYETNPLVLEVHGDSVKFDYKLYMPKKYFAKKATVDLTPVLKFGSDSVALTTNYLRGEKIDGDGTMVLRKEGDTVSFTDRVAYSDKMKSSELFLDLVAKKGKKAKPFARVKLADGVITTSQTAQNTNVVIYSKDNYQRVVPIERKGTIFFEINQAVIKKTDNNMGEIKAFDDFVKSDNEVTGVSISSFASPDGELRRNQTLAIERTKATYKYLVDFLKKNGVDKVNDSSFYKRSATSEDWDGLKQLAQQQNIEEIERLQRLISGIDDLGEREKELKRLKNYKQIAENLLPKLRRSEITFLGVEKRKSDAEIMSLALTNPQILTAEELLYSSTITENTEEKIKIWESFINLYPNDWRGYNSMACHYIDNNDFGKAEEMLEKAAKINQNNAAVLNNQGIIYLNKREYKRAEEAFNQAKSLGAKEDINLGNTKLRQGDYNAALSYYGALNAATYNSALANTLAGNYDAALANIQGIKDPGADVFYLKAIIGARKADQDLMTTNLTRAIRMDKKYRAIAVKDLEFKSYFETDAFLTAVR